MGSEHVPEAPVASLSEQVKVQVPQRRPGAIGVVETMGRYGAALAELGL